MLFCKCKLTLFQPEKLRTMIRAGEISKQLRKRSTLELFHFSYTDWLSEAPKSVQEQEDQRWHRKRQNPMCCRDSGPKERKVEKLRVRDHAERATLNCWWKKSHFTAEKYVKEGKRTLWGERNEVAVDERQTGSGKLRRERLKIIADKDQPAHKVSSWNLRWNNITAEKHQPTRMVGSWNPRGERIEIRVQRTTAYAATTPTISTVFHSKSRCHANMATLDTPTCSTCYFSWLSFTQSLMDVCVLSCNLMCTYTVLTHPCDIPPLAQTCLMMLCIYTSWLCAVVVQSLCSCIATKCGFLTIVLLFIIEVNSCQI